MADFHVREIPGESHINTYSNVKYSILYQIVVFTLHTATRAQ